MAEEDTGISPLPFKTELPPCFTGENNESFSQWIRRFEVGCETATNMRPELLVKILPSRLAGPAFRYWDSLSDQVKLDYEAAKRHLQNVFTQDQYLQTFKTFLNARPRKSGEQLEVYAAELRTLVLHAFPGYGREAINGEVFRRFLAGLEPTLQMKVQEFGADTIEDAIRVASQCERAQRALNIINPLFTNPAIPAVTPMASQTPTSVTPVALSVQGIERGAEYRDLMQKVDHLTNEVAMLRMNVETTRHQRSHYDNRDPRGSETPYHRYPTTSYSSSSPHTHDYTRGARPHSPARDERAHRYEPDFYRSHQDYQPTYRTDQRGRSEERAYKTYRECSPSRYSTYRERPPYASRSYEQQRSSSPCCCHHRRDHSPAPSDDRKYAEKRNSSPGSREHQNRVRFASPERRGNY